MQALLPLSWTTSQPEPCHAPVPHTCTHPPACNFGCITLDPAYQSKVDALYTAGPAAAETQRLIQKGAIIGTFLGDEHLYFGVQLRELKAVADALRLAYPAGIVYLNEAPDIAMCNYRKDNSSVFGDGECMPVNVDWFGFDFYQHDSVSWEAAREAYDAFVFPRYGRPDQRAVPVSLGYDGRANLTAAEAAELDTFCATNAREFFAMGLADGRFVGQFPFHYNGGVTNPDGSVTGSAGIVNLPKCLATYQGIGKIIKAAGPAGTSQDPAPRRPRPGPDGKTFVEPKCTTPLPPAPSIWSWCARH